MDFASAFGGGGGYDFGAASSEARGGTNTLNYKIGGGDFSQVAIIAAVVLLILFFVMRAK